MTSITEEILTAHFSPLFLSRPQFRWNTKETAVECAGRFPWWFSHGRHFCVRVQVQRAPTSMTRATPAGAIRLPSARRCPREATNASVPWDGKEDTARTVIFPERQSFCSGAPSSTPIFPLLLFHSVAFPSPLNRKGRSNAEGRGGVSLQAGRGREGRWLTELR